MRIVTKTAFVDELRCKGCQTCVRVCPVVAIRMEKSAERRIAKIDELECVACGICINRCAEHALSFKDRETPLRIETRFDETISKEIEAICTKAHMYPEQVICYCHRIQAGKLVAAILAGGDTPEKLARMTGVRTGCGVLCITGVLRLLKAAGVELTKAPGYQWYGKMITIWDIPEAVIEKYGKQYYIREDRESMDQVFPGGGEK